MKFIVIAFLVCLAVFAVFAEPAEDETIGSFDAVEESIDPRDPAAILKKIKLLKLKKKLFG